MDKEKQMKKKDMEKKVMEKEMKILIEVTFFKGTS